VRLGVPQGAIVSISISHANRCLEGEEESVMLLLLPPLLLLLLLLLLLHHDIQ